ncbi:DNA topoisomerase I [Malonomonas rubra DSM 5091]|uniref:DNA topoisomerase 1 n=1 Tax=Malonomonas rubra DSM 5091 TaxID=1122189 RepID=A0A1M6EZF5_MALRU|nr:type I DNA topoisomerase [Malonomonas rubra]SHI90769.1 DNA topoisomerase I [Malonomonas rubra DSM 5091]
MAQSLVIVESPAKAKTIEKFLGKGYKVLASYGHVRALPSKQGSVDTDNNFNPKYHVLPESSKHISTLKKEVAKSDELILATDLDREGEAIAWHLLEALGIDEKGDKPKVKRVTFHEITKPAIDEAMAHPREIARNLVDAQQARSILDYLVGFNLSPFLWKKIRYGLSAGRVQSVALRLIVEREEEIEAFKPREYWSIEALLANAADSQFTAKLHAAEDKKLGKFAIENEEQAKAILGELEQADFSVSSLEKKERKRNPAAPFTTSTLQQEASRKLGFSARKTMSVAQKLYEGVEVNDGTHGLITYMRTDSVALSDVATSEAREVICKLYDESYALAKPRTFKNKSKNAQEAHEAIRPTSIARTPAQLKPYLSSDQLRLYELIWKRTVASQMAQAIFDATTVDIAAGDKYSFRATGQVIRFPGFMALYIEGTDNGDDENKEGLLPPLNEGEKLKNEQLSPEQHFTQPPPRFTEASLVKTMEEYGIGRPSTYASIMNTLVTRKYVRLEKRTFFPEDTGRVVAKLLVEHFSQYVDYDFTAELEEDLDAISRGEKAWIPQVKQFWDPFIALLHRKDKEVSKADVTTEKTDKICPECGKELVIKLGRSGRFLACSGFPDCRHTEPLNGDGEPAEEPVMSDEKCEKCGEGMLIKTGRYGKFLACSGYPKCKNIQPLEKPKSLNITCPQCNEGEMMEKKSRYGKIFYSCNRYPKCKYALWNEPKAEPCPKCNWPLTEIKVTKRWGTVQRCPQEDCDWENVLIPPEKKAPAKKTATKKKTTAKKTTASKTAAKKAPAKKTITRKKVEKKDA